MAKFLCAVVFLLATMFAEPGFSARQAGVFSVLSFGAVGDGKTDDSPAFVKAWKAVCNSAAAKPKLFVPGNKIFMLNPITFSGPCKSPTVSVVIRGTLVAPRFTWDVNRFGSWISFSSVSNLGIVGGGTIDGQGQLWWGQCGKTNGLDSLDFNAVPDGASGCADRPAALHFHNCDGLTLANLNHVNPPKNHIGINGCKNANIHKLTITAPGDSPNTDGIDVSDSTGVNIHDMTIATGDDCVAVNSGSNFINITRVFCGPGHGISIGSLGGNGDFATVEEVHVYNCTFTDTMNGMRIKTYQNGNGYARKISFVKIILVRAENPIIIDQYYMDESKTTGQREKGNGIQVSDITYSQVSGTSASEEAVTFKCNRGSGCNNIVMKQVDIYSAVTGKKSVDAVCSNAHGYAANVQPVVECLKN